MHQDLLEGWLEHRLLGPVLIVSELEGMGQGLVTGISNHFPAAAAAAAGLGTIL